MPPRKRARSAAAAASDAPASLVLDGGHAEKPRTIACYRDAKHCDVEVHASDGTAFHAHGLVLMAGSDYFAAVYSGGGWADAAGPLTLGGVPAAALQACLDWIYTGTCSAAESALGDLLRAAAYLQIGPLLEATVETLSARLGPANALTGSTSASVVPTGR